MNMEPGEKERVASEFARRRCVNCQGYVGEPPVWHDPEIVPVTAVHWCTCAEPKTFGQHLAELLGPPVSVKDAMRR